jgi:hypothetical protein
VSSKGGDKGRVNGWENGGKAKGEDEGLGNVEEE